MASTTSIQLEPQLRAAFQKATEIDRDLGPVGPEIADIRERATLARSYWNQGGPDMFEVSERLIPGPVRDVPVVLYRPRKSSGPAPVFLFLHGGGFKIGNQWANDRQMREIAAAWGGVVISADYLHAPEHKFPGAVEEVAAVLQWLHSYGAAWGLDTENISFGGVSAGACIGFGAAISLGKKSWLRAAVGIVGAFSFDTSAASMKAFGNVGLFPQLDLIKPMFEAYVPNPKDRTDPRAIPVLADVQVLPQSFIAAAEYDVFRDASSLMATRLAQADRLRFFKIYPGMAHLFFGFSKEVAGAMACVSDVSRFLAECLPVSSAYPLQRAARVCCPDSAQ